MRQADATSVDCQCRHKSVGVQADGGKSHPFFYYRVLRGTQN
jgi:hypothetical protein